MKRKIRRSRAPEVEEVRIRSLASPLAAPVEEPEDYAEEYDNRFADLHNVAYAALTIGGATLLDALSKVPNLFAAELPKLFDNGKRLLQDMQDSMLNNSYTNGKMNSYRVTSSTIPEGKWGEMTESMRTLAPFTKVRANAGGTFDLMIPAGSNFVEGGKIPGFSIPELLDAVGVCGASTVTTNSIVPQISILRSALRYLMDPERTRMQQKVDDLMTRQLGELKKGLAQFMDTSVALDDMSSQMILRIPLSFKSVLNSPFIDKDLMLGDNDFAYNKDDLKNMVTGMSLVIEVSPPRQTSATPSTYETQFLSGSSDSGKLPYVRRTLFQDIVVFQPFINQAELDTLRNLTMADITFMDQSTENEESKSWMLSLLVALGKEDKPTWTQLNEVLGKAALDRATAQYDRKYKELDGNISDGAPDAPELPVAPSAVAKFILDTLRPSQVANWLMDNKVQLPKSMQTVVVDKADYKDALARLSSRSFMCRMSNVEGGSDYGSAEAVAFAEFTISEDVAAYVTQTSPPTPVDVAEWLYAHVDNSYAFGKNDSNFYKSIPKVIKETAQLPQRPRVSKDQLMIGASADLMFVPTVDPEVVTRYEEAQARSYGSALDPTTYTRQDVGMGNLKVKYASVEGQETPQVTLNNPFIVPENADPVALAMKQASLGRLGSYYIFTDWGADVLSYTTGDGHVVTTDVSAYAPATVMDLSNSLNAKVILTDLDFGYLRNSLSAWLDASGKKLVDFIQLGDTTMPPDVDTVLLGQSLTEYLFGSSLTSLSIGDYMKNFLALADKLVSRDIGGDYPFEQATKDLRYKDLTAESSIPYFRPIGRIAQAAMAEGGDALFKLLSDPTKVGNNGSAVLSRMQGVARIMALAKYATAEDMDGLKEAIAKKQQAYSVNPVKVNDDTVVQPVPFLVDGFKSLPHQVRSIVSGQRQPDKKVDHVDAGGGKTIMNVLDCLYTLGQYYARGELKGNQQKRPLMMCPKNLIKNYIEDLTYVTQGAVNFIVLGTETINRYGHDYMYKLIFNAPVNTIVLCDFDFPKNGQYSIQYGNTNLALSNNAELMRRFEWIYLSMDESQYLANLDSGRSQGVRAQTTLSENLRQTTGTYVHGQLTDAAGQFSIMSPATFGSKKDFIERFAAETFSGKVISWKPKAERQVRQAMDESADYVRISRREWAALLPEAIETFHKVSLSKKQMAVYQDILADALEAIQSDSELMKKLKSADEEEGNVANIEMLLRPYLQRLEMFIAAPAHDKVGDKLLQGNDRISPKAGVVNELFEQHMADPKNGKVLVFCAYVASAEALHASLPKALQDRVILYYAKDKDKAIPKFRKNKDIVGLIGVETSLNTGHNFQFVNRLISIDSVWSPGDFEQGQSRLNRPDPKNDGEDRPRIYFDRIIADGTIDVTKTARMMSKLLTMVRFQASDSRYDKLPSLPLVSMNLDSITDANEFGDSDNPGSLFSYVDAYGQYVKLRKDEYAQFLKTYDGPTKNKLIPTAGHLPGSARIAVPYTANMQLPFTDELGILSVTDWLADNDMDADTADMKGLQVHTEYGDGVVTSSGRGTLKVKLDGVSGTVSVDKLAVFIILKPNKVPVAQRLATLVGLPIKSIQFNEPEAEPIVESEEEAEEPVDDPEPPKAGDMPVVPVKKSVVERNTDHDGEIFVYPGVLNNMIQLALDREDPDVTDKMATALGFSQTGDYVYAIIPTYKAMSAVIDKLKTAFTIQPRYLADLETALAAFTHGKRKLLNFEAALDTDVRNFYVDRRRAVPKGELRPYVLFFEGECWIVVDTTKQPSALQVRRKVVVPTVKWASADSEWFILSNTKAEAKAELDAIVRSGVSVGNYDEVMETLKEMTLRTKKKVPVAKVNTDVAGKTIRRFASKSGARFIALVKNKKGYVLETNDGDTDLGAISEAAGGRALTKAVRASKYKLYEVS